MTKLLHCCVGLFLVLCAVTSAKGGSLPFEGLDDLRGPYDGTGVSGEALHVQPLGDAGKWKICAYWSSARNESSPWFGFGWSIPALESRFVPLDERRWAFHQPDGYVRIFVRSPQGEGLLTGGSAWTAVRKGDSTYVTADPKDGGPVSKFVFRQGRLVRMSCEEGDFEIKYTGRTADRIVSRGRNLLEVVRKKSPEESVVFKFNGGRSQVVAICHIATVFVAHGDSSPEPAQKKCLASLQTAEGVIPFTYGGEYDEAFFTAGDTRWTWNARTRKILSCGDWTYTIDETKHKHKDGGLSFSRYRSADACRESYRYDRKTGILAQEFTNGTSRVRQVFTSGPLAYRRVRWTKETNLDGESVRTEYTYDETGRVVYRRIIREGEKEEKDEVWLDKSGKIIRRRVNGEEVTVE